MTKSLQQLWVGVATHYGPGIKSRRWRDFSHPSRLALESTQPPVQGVPVLYRAVISRGLIPISPPPSVEVKEGIELYFHSPSGPSWPVTGWELPFRVIDFAMNNNVIMKSTYLPHKNIQKDIWQSSDERNSNHINHVLVTGRQASSTIVRKRLQRLRMSPNKTKCLQKTSRYRNIRDAR